MMSPFFKAAKAKAKADSLRTKVAKAEADVAVAITGIAGPGGSDHKPEGRVCFGLAQQGRETWAETVEFGALGRDKVRMAARDHALGLLARALAG